MIDDTCNELIDTSSAESLERDFYLWLKGELFPQQTPTPTRSLPPIEQLSLGSTVTYIKQEVDSDGFSPSSSMDSEFSPPANLHRDNLMAAYSTASLLLCQQQFGSAGMDNDCFNQMGNPSVFRYDHLTIGNMSSGKNLDMKPIKSELESGQPTMKVSVPKHVGTPIIKAQWPQGGRNSGTNQLGRSYNPGLPLSIQERQQIVSLYRAGWKICDISKQLCVTHSCVSKILHRFRQTGSVKPKDAKEGRIESPLVKAIREYRLRLGICRQSEIREQLIKDGLCRKENAPSRSSINHILRTKLDVRLKKMATKQ
ncbi:Paired box protein Pax-2-B [Aphelenchoides bicaudatus]|nr:Paired box protein Pax-2-B [Aphelenchoides bicaudatus]